MKVSMSFDEGPMKGTLEFDHDPKNPMPPCKASECVARQIFGLSRGQIGEACCGVTPASFALMGDKHAYSNLPRNVQVQAYVIRERNEKDGGLQLQVQYLGTGDRPANEKGTG